ncbi:MAG: hypothetical protein QNJ75_04210 [Acidimicrobiia bacterium]|nr:hypothetical protein [Acidimicrobiia bacterium]
MSTPRSFVWLFAAVVVGAACTSSAEDAATSSPSPSSSVPSTTLAVTAPDATKSPTATPSSTLTTAIAAPSATPSYLVYGWEGVTRVHDSGSEQLVAEPVRWAAEDGAGGIVFESVAEQPGRAWLPAGAGRPTEIPNGFFFLLDGRPTAMMSRYFDDMTRCDNQGFMEELSIRDLTTGAERFFMCREFSSDGWREVTSFGGGLFSSLARWQLLGSGSGDLRFYDLEGQEVPVEHDPFAELCGPCRVDARLSPDGALLAYSLWPTALVGYPEPSDGDYSQTHREWYEEQQHIPTQVVVMDMATGVEIFRTNVVADAALTGFDGRIATVTTTTGRKLFDIESGETFTAPHAGTEPAGYWTVMLASLDNTSINYDTAQLIASDLATQHDVETGVLWSDGFVTLNPGFWAVLTGHFPTQDEAYAHCEALETDCYPRYVATADIDGTENGDTPEPEIELQHVVRDGFETYPVGAYPTEGGWYNEWSGREGYVSDAYSNTGDQSLRLSGYGNWVRTDALLLDLSRAVGLTYEVAIYCSSEDANCAEVGFFVRTNPNESWAYNSFHFHENRHQINVKGTGPRIGGPPGAYELDTGLVWEQDRWYLLRTEIDFAEGTTRFWIDGEQVAEDLIAAPRDATSIFELSTNYGYENAVVYFDDVHIEILNAPTTTPVADAATLRGDGLGLVSFGDPVDDVLATLEEVLGPPDDFLNSREDIINSDGTYFYGGPDMTEVLAIWRPIGLFAAFSPYPFYREDGLLHFSGWATTPADQGVTPVRTEAGIGVGSTYDEVERTYGDRLVMNDDVCGPAAYVIPEGEDDATSRIGLVFEGETTEPGKAQLVALHAGASPGC